MIIVYNKLLPFGNYKLFNLFSIVFSKSKNLSDKDKNHEKIHSLQMLELGVVGVALLLIICLIAKISTLYALLGVLSFYVWYGVEYLIVQCFHKTQNEGYHDISLEEEAYINDDNLYYINNRKLFNWVKYLKPKSY